MRQPKNSGFDTVAPFYDSLSRLVFGNSLRQAQLAHLRAIPARARILLIGGGSGWLLEKLLQLQPSLTVTYLEASPKMLQMAQARLAKNQALATAPVTFRLGTEDALQPGETFDVILTPFLLDLFPDQRLRPLLDRLYQTLTSGGSWLFSDFCPVQLPPPLWQRLLLQSMYTFFGLLSGVEARALPDFEQHFARLQLQEERAASFYGGMVQAKVYRKV
ncbi:methyltransferase type 12 [Pontibacter sp. HJ8]